jgi:hypothetical protein
MATWKIKSCPRCGGDLFVYSDLEGWYEECLQCAYERELKSTAPVRGMAAWKAKEPAVARR